MKPNRTLRGLTLAFIASSATLPALAQPSMKDHIQCAHADGKGEVITTDKGGFISFWSLADGKLIEKLSGGDVQVPVRAMRHKLQSASYLEMGFEYKCGFVADSFICTLQTNGAFTARIARHKDTRGTWIRNRTTRTIAVYSMSGGMASILLVNTDSPTDAAGRLVGRMLPAYARPEVEYSLRYSPKGNWLIDHDLRQIISTQTGRIVSFANAVGKGEKFSDEFVFSPDEGLFALAITGYGMKAIETETGKVAGSYPLPKSLRKLKGREVYPAADCKSYVYTGALTSESMDVIVQDAFLVKGDQVIELKE